MKIAFDIGPINSSSNSHHKIRGVGKYISLLRENLEKYDRENSYHFFTDVNNLTGDIDIIHYPYFEPFFLTLPFFNKIKTVVTVHDLTPIVFSKEFPIGIKGYLKWQVQKFLLRKVDAIITDSNSSKQDILKILRVSSGKVSVIYLAADEDFEKKAISNKDKELFLNKYNLPEKFGLYVGDATSNKNLPNLVNAINKSKIPFVFVGKAFSEKVSNNLWNKDLILVQNEIKDNSLFTVLGFLPKEDLVTIYNLASFLILPSKYEGFGLPILEAMKCGCPVITTKEGSLPEVAGDAAFYVNAYDSLDIAKGMETVFSSKNVRDELIKKGLEQAKKFSWKKTVEETIEIYNKVNSS